MKTGQASGWRIQAVSMITIFAISIGVYSNSLKNSFVYDDEETVTQSQLIRSWKNLPVLFTSGYFEDSGEISYRPIVTLTYFIDYTFWGVDPKGYHLTNILLHALNAALVYIFVRLLADRYANPGATNTAFLAGIIFSVHPALSETVNAISYREDMLAACFLLLSFILFIRVRYVYPIRPFRFMPLYGSSLVLFFMALLSKEMAVTLPFLLILLDVSANNPSHDGAGRGVCSCHQGIDKRDGGRWVGIRSRLVYIGYFVVCGVYLSIRLLFLYNPDEDINYREYNLLTNLLTMTKVVASYIRLLFCPLTLNADYVVSYSSSPLGPAFLISISLLMVVLAILIKAYRNLRYIFFAAVWFFVALIPVLNIIPIVNIMAERYLYIPSIGFFIISACLLGNNMMPIKASTPVRRLISGMFQWGRWGSLRLVMFVVLAISCAYLTIRRNVTWSNNLSLWSETIKDSPFSAKGYYSIGLEYFERKDTEEAIKGYERAINLSPNYYRAYNNLGMAYEKKGLMDEAIEAYKKAIYIRPGYVKAHNNLGIVYFRKGEMHAAIKEYMKAIELDSAFAPAYFNLGNVYMRQGLFVEAEKMYKRSIYLDPRNARSYNGLGELYLQKGLASDAIMWFKNALEYDHGDSLIHLNLGNAYKRYGLYETALKEYNEAIRFDTSNIDARNMLGLTYADMGRLDDAIAAFSDILKMDSNNSRAHNNMGNLYYMKGLTSEAEGEYILAIKLDSQNSNAYKNLAILYIDEDRDKAQALSYLKEALRTASDVEEVKQISEMIKGLQ